MDNKKDFDKLVETYAKFLVGKKHLTKRERKMLKPKSEHLIPETLKKMIVEEIKNDEKAND